MAPLDIFDENQNLKYADKLNGWFSQLKSGNVDGVMIDVWWGLVETAPKTYKWDGYNTVFKMMRDNGLKIIPVMSFHKCGGNVGDQVTIPIPSFILNSQEQPFFKDKDGNVDNEYISFAYDTTVIANDRTPLQMYADFQSAFYSNFRSYFSSGVISEVEVGMGPCGELRYPSYQLKYWSFPGCGEFQVYDNKFRALLSSDAAADGHPTWTSPPGNTGGYNTKPGEADYWRENANSNYKSDFGMWFNKWLNEKLAHHAQSILSQSRLIFPSTTTLSAKIPGIHWWYDSGCHCAETTAGLANFWGYDGYKNLLSVFQKHDADLCFTCLEMSANSGTGSDPQTLVGQLFSDSQWANIGFSGENALACYDWDSWNRIANWAQKGMKTFTFLRMGDDFFNNWNNVKNFVNKIHNP